MDYAALPDIDTFGVEKVDARDRECLNDIGALLIARGVNDRFGISLLHSHFPLGADELMIQAANEDQRKITLLPTRRPSSGSAAHHAINFMFGAALKRDALSLVGSEYVGAKMRLDVCLVSFADESALREIRNSLERHGRLRRFGVGWLHDPLGVRDVEILLETCGKIARTLHCHVAAREGVDIGKFVETAWSWESQASDVAPESMRLCRRQCTRVCLRAGNDGHQPGGHEPSGHEPSGHELE